MADAVHQFGQISMGSRGAVSQGLLKISDAGFTWRKSGGGKTVEVKRDDISGLVWTKLSRGCQLGIRRNEDITINFLGFREKDLAVLKEFASSAFDLPIEEQTLSTSGRNWGSLQLHGSSLAFRVDNKVAIEVPLADVSQVQQQKDEIMLEFHVDDTTADDKEDALTEMAFHVPATNEDFPAQGADNPAKVLADMLMQYTDAGATTTDEIVCEFNDVHILTPRGRFLVEMHMGHMQLNGQSQDFKIRYANIMWIFVLPKTNTPHTAVVISLDQPIRKGQTYYSHLLTQFHSEEQIEVQLSMTAEQMEAKNEKFGGKLTNSVSGVSADVFAKVLRGLSGARITRPKTFRNSAGDGYAVRCSYKADDGYLYPLEKAFFYIHKPPLLITHDEIESIEFQRQGGGVVSSNVRTCDLKISLRDEKDYQFRNIQRTELKPLKEFMVAKKLRIENLAEEDQGMTRGVDLGEDVDPGMWAAESDEEDEDFEGGAGSGSGSESESGSGSDAGSDDGTSAEMVEEEGITVEAISGGKRKKGEDGEDEGETKPAAKKKPKEKGPPKEKAAKGAKEEGGKKPKKKKDPNAPKKALTAFFFFSKIHRDKIKEENPGASFGDVGKLLGERWRGMSPEEKAPYEEQAKQDTARYASDMAKYKAAPEAGGEAEVDEAGSE